MKAGPRIVWGGVVVASLVGVLLLKQQGAASPTTADEPTGSWSVSVARANLPRMVEFGSTTCIPCRAMAPILAELRRDNGGKLEVEFVDVMRAPEQMDKHNLNVIPSQVFFAPDGKELFRHEGFFPKDEILDQWQRLGYELQ
jgi:thioredoxin 1